MKTKEQLRQQSIGTQQLVTTRKLTESELAILSDKVAQEICNKEELEEELREHTKIEKNRIKNLKTSINEQARILRTKHTLDTRTVCIIPNYASEEMEFYDVNTCELVEKRRMTPVEKQSSLHSVISMQKRTGTDGGE